MITISTNTKKIYINTNTLKNRLKEAFLTLIKAVAIGCGLFGLTLIVGTAGSSDLNLISFNQIIKQVFHGFLFMGSGYILSIIKNALQ